MCEKFEKFKFTSRSVFGKRSMSSSRISQQRRTQKTIQTSDSLKVVKTPSTNTLLTKANLKTIFKGIQQEKSYKTNQTKINSSKNESILSKIRKYKNRNKVAKDLES